MEVQEVVCGEAESTSVDDVASETFRRRPVFPPIQYYPLLTPKKMTDMMNLMLL